MSSMDIGSQISSARTRFYRWRRLGAIDSIDSVKRRHPDFDDVVNRIRQSGTDSLSHFGNGYTHEGGLLLQQNPDEFAALTLFLRERGPYQN